MAMSILPDILAANSAFADDFAFGELPLPPAKRAAILTCMDARIDAHALSGLGIGDAHIIRNAGGRATEDAIRSLVISSKLLGTREWLVIHHTDCGMELFTDEAMGELLAESLGGAELGSEGWKNTGDEGGSPEGRYMKWHAFRGLEQSVRDDAARIKSHPLVNKSVTVYGLIYDVRSGRLTQVD